MRQTRRRTIRTIQFSERGNPRRYTLEIDQPVSNMHEHMLGAIAGNYVMRQAEGVTPMMPSIDDLFVDVPTNTIPSYKADDNIEECSVCQEMIKKGDMFRRLPCSDTVNHCFHTNCIDPWLQSHSTCPNCRSNIIN